MECVVNTIRANFAFHILLRLMYLPYAYFTYANEKAQKMLFLKPYLKSLQKFNWKEMVNTVIPTPVLVIYPKDHKGKPEKQPGQGTNNAP